MTTDTTIESMIHIATILDRDHDWDAQTIEEIADVVRRAGYIDTCQCAYTKRADHDYCYRCNRIAFAERVGVNEEDIGQCDHCDMLYVIYDRDDHCGECGCCHDHCTCAAALYVVSVGDTLSGVILHGPFDTADDAFSFAQAHPVSFVTQLRSPA